MAVWQDVLQSKITNVSQSNNTSNVTGTIVGADFDYEVARASFDNQWENLISRVPANTIYQGSNCYICCGRKYFFSGFNDLYLTIQEISIIVDGYEDAINKNFNKVTFSVTCALDRKNNEFNYYDRHKNKFKTGEIGSETHENMIEILMNEAVK